MLLIIISIIVFLGVLLFIIFSSSKQKFSDLEIQLQEAENNMDLFLEKKIELINRLIAHLKKKKITVDLPDTEQYKKEKLERHQLQYQLFDTYTEIIHLVDDNEEKLSDKKSISFLDQLSDNEDDLIACVKYYNDTATDFNYLLHHFPTSLVAIFCHRSQLELFRNEKRETFEILKEK